MRLSASNSANIRSCTAFAARARSVSGRSRVGECDGDVTGDNAPSFPGDAATAAEVCRTDLAADDVVCLSATDTRGDRTGDLGDIGGEFTGDVAASSSLNANGPRMPCVSLGSSRFVGRFGVTGGAKPAVMTWRGPMG